MLIGVTFAWLSVTLRGTKENVIKVGSLTLTLDDTMGNGINLEEAFPLTDIEGERTTPYTFTLENTSNIESEYSIYLDNLPLQSGEEKLEDNNIKYCLTREGEEFGYNLLSTTGTNPDRILASGMIPAHTKYTYTLRLWIDEDATEDIAGQVFRGQIRVEANQIYGAKKTILLNNPVKGTKKNMFDYSNEGKKYDITTKTKVNYPNYITNGLYSTIDEDGTSYYFRGNVNNIVKFGKYEKDYYVYQATVSGKTYNYVSLAACQFADSTCTEANKVKFASAGDDMYWKIIRVNGDGTVRMIYSGTSVDETGMNAGIGISRYNVTCNDLKYSGYTYDNGTDSNIKTEIDIWYNNNLKGTSYDKKIAVGKFCSDSSGTVEDGTELITKQNWPAGTKMFQTARRVWNDYVGTGNYNAPNLVCPETDKTYGGRYNLKAGLITGDEMNLAGLTSTENGSNYLRNGHWFWSMTPSTFRGGVADVFAVNSEGYLSYWNVNAHNGLIRPVINLSVDAKFAEGGNGSSSSPYVVE